MLYILCFMDVFVRIKVKLFLKKVTRSLCAIKMLTTLSMVLTFSLRGQDVCSSARIITYKVSIWIQRTAVEVVDDLRGTSLFLVGKCIDGMSCFDVIGMNCTMKTDLGKILADSLRYYYFDSDSLIQQAAGGTSAAKTFREEDEKGFQSAETEVLKQLSAMGRLVVCAGDGAVQSATNLSYLRYGVSIWVDVPLDYLANEFMVSEASSSIMSTTQETDQFTKVMNVLLRQYNKLKEGFAIADTTVSLLKVASQLGHEDLTAVTAEDMALETLKGIQKLTRVKKMMEEAGRPF
ncbi:hypothetical protein ZIOFF_025811 [Zingiber officinale]|uniref:Inactive shikimate kinase like 1, chloroplastic n=1 Tax=Zingiber officinale TaxID=94328 RepID=A0A8J5H452_ZINOF|nr:hypothetical protein ZIOFF_025811 [Zingiber officinale]